MDGYGSCNHATMQCVLQNKREEQMQKRRNMTIEPETPLAESNKQVSQLDSEKQLCVCYNNNNNNILFYMHFCVWMIEAFKLPLIK